jgi:hypothetical protein
MSRPRIRGRTAAALLTALLAVLLTAGPALAAAPGGNTGPGGGGGTGCSGVTCYADVWQYVHLSGNAASAAGGNGPQIALPPPPCYMEPMFSGPELYALWKQGSSLPGDPEAVFAQYVPQIKLYKDSTAGYWWERVTNLQNGGTCGLPLLAWVVNGAAPPLPAVPAIDLAEYAYDHMLLPAPALTFNPAVRSYVDLPTYVWAGLPFTLGTVTATLGDESATVTAPAGDLRLAAGGEAQVYESGCTARGSTAPDPPPDAGPGTVPGCGVTFTAPSPDNMITGSIIWTPVSGARRFPLIQTASNRGVPVDEIQSLND